MLDDLKYIHEKDQSDLLGTVAKNGSQLREQFVLDPAHFGEVRNVVEAAMGGSALPGMLVRSWPELRVPYQLVRTYDIPAYVDERTLFIADSYSGNTEEVVSALQQAIDRHAQVVVIARGGKLEEIARSHNLPFLYLPDVLHPRLSVFENFKAKLEVFIAAGIVDAAAVRPVVARAAEHIDKAVHAWLPTVPTKDNPAKQLARELMGQSVVVYAGYATFPAAYKWKIDLNENAKQLAWSNEYPEFNHNEQLGWTEQPVDKPYVVVELRSNLEHERIQKRFTVSERLLSGRRPRPFVVELQGDNILEQILWGITYGDFVSVYLGLLNGLDPGPIDLVERFKKTLDE